MDCGFHGFSFESKIMNLDHFFLIRMKEGDSHSLLQIPKEYDINPEVDSTKKLILMKKPLKQYTGDALHYPLRGKDKSCLDANGEHPFSIRLVKIQATSGSNSPGTFQYFITNLPESEYPIDDIQSLYKSRWEIETAFLELKQSARLQAVHARKIDSVKQKIWARLTLCNLCSAAIQYAEACRLAPRRPPKKKTRINRKFAFEMLRMFFNFEILDEEYVLRQIWKRTSQLKPDRHFKRHTQRKPDSNQHRML